MAMLPFLYLPDAVTLVLLLIVLWMLRKAAIDHIRQELFAMREEMLFYWTNNRLDPNDGGYEALRKSADSCIDLAPRLTPARLVFIYRLRKSREADRGTVFFPDPSLDAACRIERTGNAQARAKLKRLQTEMNMSLGVFFLMGSLSGWFLLSIVVPKILRRTLSHRKKYRVDYFFDMVERMLVSFGRQAQQFGRAQIDAA